MIKLQKGLIKMENIGKSFSKAFADIKLVKSFEKDIDYIKGKHDIESIWHSQYSGCFAFYRSSGIRAITSRLYNEMKEKKIND